MYASNYVCECVLLAWLLLWCCLCPFLFDTPEPSMAWSLEDNKTHCQCLPTRPDRHINGALLATVIPLGGGVVYCLLHLFVMIIKDCRALSCRPVRVASVGGAILFAALGVYMFVLILALLPLGVVRAKTYNGQLKCHDGTNLGAALRLNYTNSDSLWRFVHRINCSDALWQEPGTQCSYRRMARHDQIRLDLFEAYAVEWHTICKEERFPEPILAVYMSALFSYAVGCGGAIGYHVSLVWNMWNRIN